MDDPALALILDQSLAMLEAGESIDSIVACFPECATSLRPLLSLANRLSDSAGDAVEVPFDFLRELGRVLAEMPATGD